MKKVFALAALAAAFSFSVQAQEPRSPVRRSLIERSVRYVGHQAKATITDLKHPSWDALVLVEVASFLADNKSTCDGFAHGFRESNFLYGHTHSCAKITALGSGYTFGRLMLMHTFNEETVNWCAESSPGEPHPERCGVATWMLFSGPWIVRARQTWCNEALIDGGCKLAIKHPKSMANRE